MTEKTKWLSREEEIPEATQEELERAIITLDGRGKEFKRKVLAEIVRRTVYRVLEVMWDTCVKPIKKEGNNV